jgi:hypothetical protein
MHPLKRLAPPLLNLLSDNNFEAASVIGVLGPEPSS